MIIKKSDRKENPNSDTCIAYEYPFGDKDINVAIVTIDGRYPEQGFVTNEKIKELILVLDGEGLIGVDDEVYEVSEGDAVLALPGQRLFYDGQLMLSVSCNPAMTRFSPRAVG